jgi:integrase
MVAVAHRLLPSVPSTVGDALLVVLERAVAAGSSSAYDIESRSRYLVEHALRPVAEVTPGWLAAELRRLHRSGLAPSTVRGVASLWMAVLAEGEHVIDSRLLRLPRVERRSIAERAPLRVEELARVVRSAAMPRWQLAPVVAGCLTGARAGEICGWRVRDYDRVDQVLRWSEQVRQRGARTRAPTKDKASREVPVHAELVPLLEEMAEGRGPDEPLLWRLVRGRRAAWSGNELILTWGAVCAAHGIERRTPHAGRYTLPTLLLEAGAPAIAVRSLTHPATVGRAAEGGARAGYDGAWGRYVAPTLDARRDAVACLRLPLAVVTTAAQLTLF